VEVRSSQGGEREGEREREEERECVCMDAMNERRRGMGMEDGERVMMNE